MSELSDSREETIISSDDSRTPSLLDAIIPAVVLMCLLSASVYFYGDNSSGGANQMALILTAAVAAIIGIKNGFSWDEIEDGIKSGIVIALKAIMILFSVGSLIGAWIMSGTVPSMIYYAVQLLDPSWFYPAACLICAIVALCIGSSWTVAGTIGIGFIGAATVLDLSLAATAGAVISGAYFGDKMSPLSDTTNLASAAANTDLFTHIRHMMWTTTPSFVIALILFTWVGIQHSSSGELDTLNNTLQALQGQFDIGIYLLLPLVVVFVMAYKQFPVLPSIWTGIMLGLIFAVIFQTKSVIAMGATEDLGSALQMVKGSWTVLFDGYKSGTGDSNIDDLLTRGGMSSMLNTVWLIICAMIFSAIMEKTGILARLVSGLINLASSTGSLIFTTVCTGIGVNLVSSDQYIAVVIPGRMYQLEFEKRGLAPQNLSRAIEDSATITSPLVPWNTCGVFMAGTLGVATFAYLPFCFFNLISPLMTTLYGFTNFKITPLEEAQTQS
ncbi:Na+/H+ antiporter NhaC [Pseudoteredinibacter isoporae]|uniref:NhaC family Na+:H+ antiporter n=1 Tax=Pseudoteredinibacter isoporae TaxID=570281 RepID=A0A7X0JW80_9GAMM|nr:Na+/H+ antiporter NhaC [Pseudoteredinibacter isoporae]MBB6522863.1 NhaC family Na+:H+ antiporter [Pseudoteredinibacter isoporae]